MKIETYLALEEALARPLRRDLTTALKPVLGRILAFLEAGEYDDAMRVAHGLDFSSWAVDYEDHFRGHVRNSLVWGAMYAAQSKNILWMDEPLPDFVEDVVALLKTLPLGVKDGIVRGVTALVYSQNLEKSDECPCDHHAVQMFQKATTLSLADRLNAAAMGTGKAVIDVAANLTTSRLANYGFLAQFDKLGYTEYQINAVLDRRTCPVCAYLHGKTFVVPSSRQQLFNLLKQQDPEMLKVMAPFPKQDKARVAILYSKTNEQLRNTQGLNLPPYHPSCRCLASKSGTVPPDKIIDPRAPDPETTAVDLGSEVEATLKVFQNITQMQEKGIKVTHNYATDGEANGFLQTLNLNFPAVYARMTAGIPSEYTLSDVRLNLRNKAAFLAFNVDKAGERAAKIRRAFYRSGDEVVVEHDLFEVHKGFQGAGLSKALLVESFKTYKAAGINRVELYANVDVGGYAWARYGFSPDAGDWDFTKAKIVSKLKLLQDLKSITPEQFNSVLALIDNDDPRSIWNIADLSVRLSDGRKLGQALLLGTDWGGTLKFSDADQIRRLNAYLGTKF